MCSLFATLMQNELNSDSARFTTQVQTWLATNQVVASCEKLSQKTESSSTFATKSVHVARLPIQGKLVLQQVTYLLCMASLPRNLSNHK